MPLAFFLSCCFYSYLRWRQSRSAIALLAYGCFGALACLTHFSAMFGITCFAVHEGLENLRCRVRLRDDAGWLLVNSAVLVLGLALYCAWQPMIQAFAQTYLEKRFDYLAAYALAFPLEAASYALPGDTASLGVVALMLAAAFKNAAPEKNNNVFRACLTLTGIALALGTALIATSLYPFPGTRHSTWIVPFLVPPAGYILAASSEWLGDILARQHLLLWRNIMAPLILLCGWATYNPAHRFSDVAEYTIPDRQWQAIAPFLASLGPADLIVAERDDAVLLESLYPFLGDNPLMDKKMIVLAPYERTHILFSPFYRRLTEKDTLTGMLREAETHGFFEGVDRLVFLRTAVTHWPVNDLINCPALGGKAFIPPGAALHTGGANAYIMTVPAQNVLQDVLLPEGPAYGCLAAGTKHFGKLNVQ
jgi:hypothetical protein